MIGDSTGVEGSGRSGARSTSSLATWSQTLCPEVSTRSTADGGTTWCVLCR